MNDAVFVGRFRAVARRLTRRGLGFRAAATLAGLGLAAGGRDGVDAGHKHKKTCKHGKKRCGKKCRNLQTDNTNCGACGNVCPLGLPCQGGACACLSAGDDVAAAVRGAKPGQTICLYAGIFAGDRIEITRNVELVGAGSGETLVRRNLGSAVANGEVFRIRMPSAGDGPLSVRLEGMAIAGGRTTGDGGGILCDSAALTLVDVALGFASGFDTPSGPQFNTADGNGGGIAFGQAATGTLTDSTVTLNTAGGAGGGIDNANPTANSVTLQGTSSVTNNNPDNCAGTAITGCSG